MEKLNINLAITVATILISLGVSWGLVQAKIGDVDKTKNQVEDVDKRLIKVEANLGNIDENLKEQKSNLREQKEDIKQVLKLLMEKHATNN